MDQHVRENWRKIKEALEKADKTDSMFYLRAKIIAAGAEDPIENYMPSDDAE